ncbi:MAG: ketopantoate reductase family protein [Spirochaetia bacterium]
MQVSILGPGAVGTLIGGLLKLKGHDVSLKGRRAPARSESVLRIVLPGSWLLVDGVRTGDSLPATWSPDAVLVTLGRQHVHALRRPDFARHVPPGDSPVAFFNCDPVEADRLGVPADRLRLCLTLMTAVKLQDADVELSTEKPIILYEGSPVLDRLFQGLSSFGFQAVAVPDARPYLNSLLVWQLLFLPVAMCNTTLGVFLSSPEGRELAAGLIGEGCAAMAKAGMPMAPLPLMDPRELAGSIARRPGSFASEPGRPDRGYTSMLQCYLRGRPTEAPQLNRRIVEIASDAGLHLTWNWRILQKVSRVSGLGFYRTPAELLRSLV